MNTCPYCGGLGRHIWAGTGQCPGIQEDETERLRAAIQAQKIALGDQGKEIERLRRINVSLVAGERVFREEIDRLKELAESWKGGHSIAALDRDLAHNQIKRVEEALQRQDNAIIDKKAEIERLKFLNNEERETIEELSRLCARAADALAGCTWQERDALIVELRKAAE